MKQLVFSIALTLFTSLIAFSQDSKVSNWSRSGSAGLNFAQSHLSNWAAGGENALNSSARFIYQANYEKGKNKWNTNLDLGLGYSIIGDNKAIKTDDKIEINSMIGHKATENLHYSLSFSFKSQFADGFDYKTDSTNPISRLMAPAYLTLGFGMDWAPNKVIEVNFSPATARMTFVTDQKLADAGAFGVDPAVYNDSGIKTKDGMTSRFEFGGKLVAKLNVDIAKNVNFNSKLELFSDYIKNPQNIDIDWQNMFTMKVNSWLNANITMHMIYDDDITITDKDGKKGPRTQFKEVLSIGIAYKF